MKPAAMSAQVEGNATETNQYEVYMEMSKRVVKVTSMSFGTAPVLLTQEAYSQFLRLADREELVSHSFVFTPINASVIHLDFYGTLELPSHLTGLN